MVSTLKITISRWPSLLLAIVLLSAGCVAGKVLDAETGEPLTGVTVEVIDGQCSDEGRADCTSRAQTTRTISGAGITVAGAYVFDAYGEINGTDNIQVLSPEDGAEAISLRFTRAGYHPALVWHPVKTTEIAANGKTYLASLVQTVSLARDGTNLDAGVPADGGPDSGAGCSADAECPSGQACVSGTCRPQVGCSANAECPSGQACMSGTCRPQVGCSANAECPSGQACVSGTCRPAEQSCLSCAAAAECPTGHWCSGGICRAEELCDGIDNDCDGFVDEGCR